MYWLKIELPKLSSHSQVATQPSKVMPWLTGIWLDPWLNLAITSGLPQNLPILIMNSFNTTEHTSTFWTLKSFLKSLCQTANFKELRGPFTWCATFWTSQWVTGCNMEPLCLEKRTERPHEWNDPCECHCWVNDSVYQLWCTIFSSKATQTSTGYALSFNYLLHVYPRILTTIKVFQPFIDE